MKEYKDIYREINLGGGRIETALIGKVEVPTREKKHTEKKAIDGGADLGYGYFENGLYNFKGVVDSSLSFCKKYAEKRRLPKWSEDSISYL